MFLLLDFLLLYINLSVSDFLLDNRNKIDIVYVFKGFDQYITVANDVGYKVLSNLLYRCK